MILTVLVCKCGYSTTFDRLLLQRNPSREFHCVGKISLPGGEMIDCPEVYVSNDILKNIDGNGIWDLTKLKPEEKQLKIGGL